MVSRRWQFAFVLAVAGLLWLAARSWAQGPPVQEQIKLRPPNEPPAAFPQVAAGKAVVIYQNGQLTIEAKNALLIDVLRAVCKQIGAELDSQVVADERVFNVLGPGPTKEVLAALLSNSHFNYAMAESPNDPNTLASVVVFPRTNGSTQQGNADSGAQNRVSQEQAQGSSTDPKASAIDMKSSLKEMKELLAAARAEAAAGAVIETQGENGMVEPDAAAILQQIEAQLNAIGDVDAAALGANSPQTGQQPDNPLGRSRHRGRH